MDNIVSSRVLAMTKGGWGRGKMGQMGNIFYPPGKNIVVVFFVVVHVFVCLNLTLSCHHF